VAGVYSKFLQCPVRAKIFTWFVGGKACSFVQNFGVKFSNDRSLFDNRRPLPS